MGLVGLIELEPNLEPVFRPGTADPDDTTLWTALTEQLSGQAQSARLPASNRLLNPVALNAGQSPSASYLPANLHHLAQELGATASQLRANLAAGLAN